MLDKMLKHALKSFYSVFLLIDLFKVSDKRSSFNRGDFGDMNLEMTDVFVKRHLGGMTPSKYPWYILNSVVIDWESPRNQQFLEFA